MSAGCPTHGVDQIDAGGHCNGLVLDAEGYADNCPWRVPTWLGARLVYLNGALYRRLPGGSYRRDKDGPRVTVQAIIDSKTSVVVLCDKDGTWMDD